MKSIIEEASSVVKAIEKGWLRAGKPQEFTIKVFEESQKNFIGMTTKSAKVGIFFQEPLPVQQTRPQSQQQPVQRKTAPQPQQQQQAVQQKPVPAPVVRPLPQAQPQAPVQPVAPKQEKQPRREYPTDSPWNEELTAAAQKWVNDSLALLKLSNVLFETQIDRYALKLTFNKQFMGSTDKQKDLFRAWAYLIMQALRYKFKRPLKGLKIILTSNA